MATSYALCLFCNLTFFTCLASIMIGSSVITADSDLVERMCGRSCSRATSSDKFCKDALNSDWRTPGADATILAYVAFGLAHLNASSTQDQITSLLSNSTGPVRQHLEQCLLDYATALNNTEEALTDLDWEEFGRLTSFAATAWEQAKNCESAFNGTKSPLTDNNNNLFGLSEICVCISQQLIV
ncbi:uncharacterized protein LOC125316500 [Rhodamnia argentea]|uniref:Uncharacterized protein LOC125316500 n=1 Tax=Rhodamnia argentea TaxID=178133 RepID=A0ABM3HW51_9MYRT|nr:uncharacterized protein LOC125316500 [Rhodamnia argentea]